MFGKVVLLILISGFLLATSDQCFSQDCNKVPASFGSYEQASIFIKSTSFKLRESANTTKSSWIRGATYYSCDSKKGFLIIKTDDREYIHQNVPINIWNGFKNAGSFGSYYNEYIKGKFRLALKE